MPTITIEIPKKVLERAGRHNLLVVDPVEFERELRSRWEVEDARIAKNIAKREEKPGKARAIKYLRVLM